MQNPCGVFVAIACLALAGCTGDGPEKIQASGTLEGTDVNVGTEVAGRVKEVRVEEGALVRHGDTLVVIDDTDYRLQLRQARANEESADALYRLALEGSRKEDILQAEAAFTTARADYERMKSLLVTKTITQKQHDDAYARYVAAEQTYEKLIRGSRNQEIVAARARRDLAAAQAELLRKKVNDCVLLSPQEGVVTLRAVEPGELVGVGSNLLRISYLRTMKLTIYVAEADLGKVRLGQSAKVTIDSYPERTFDGTVAYISPLAEFTPKNVQTREERTKLVFGVRILVANPDGALKPGLPADAMILTGTAQTESP